MKDDLGGEIANSILPLVDVIFILLASILILARVGGVEAGIETPDVKENQQSDIRQIEADRLDVRIAGDGIYHLGLEDTEPLKLHELTNLIQEGQQEIHLHFRRYLPSFELVTVLGEIKKIGNLEVRLHYDQSEESGDSN